MSGRPARVAIMALLLVFGLVQGVSAAESAEDVTAAHAAKLKARLERRSLSQVTQEDREAAAARMRLQKTMIEAERSILGVKPSAVRAAVATPPGPGGIPDYFGSTPNWAYSPLIRKFVDGLPGLGSANANNLGQYLSVAHPDTKTYPGSDYYEIELREYWEKLHTDLPPTKLRGYVQVNKGTDAFDNNTLAPDPIHYLGPTIFATKDRPVRVKFTNKLPTGEGGDLFIPVDTSIMGAGKGPTGDMYTQNRAALHLHGGKTVWISDGTPHQWITPADEVTPYPKGVSVKNVPDMPDPGPGSMTLFYSNQQSARMLWYHDHSYGITRLNVYAGEAAAYMLTDDVEKELVDDGLIPSDQIPLTIQDKTFVDASTIATTDPTWNWGSGYKDPGTGIRTPRTGDLWVPHVYVPAQNPADPSGMNATGRWHYSPWFWPPVTNIEFPPTPNPYYDPVNAPWEPELMPGTPNPSVGMEAYNDTPLVNGTPYPVLEVDPKSYRLRILNAANDRFLNLQMFVADPDVVTSDGRRDTEVKMVPAVATTGFPELWPTDGRLGGAPDPATAGPEWVQIGTESGFLPKPAVIPNQPITWNGDPTTFNAGNVQDHSLLLGTAERADVVVDFSRYAGQTLILYNDAPTAFPALDQRTDYFTDGPDMTDTGGTKSTKAGFGPNTRTIMQIKVAAQPPAAAFDLDALNAAFASTDSTPGVFAKGQNPIIIPDARYNEAYNATFAADPYVRIYQNETSFKTMDGRNVTIPLEPKAIQDETSEVWDYEYGRMSGKLGLEMPRTNAGNANFILYSFIDPVTEILQDSGTPLSPVGEDGTQIWKITHNGVDTHPIHTHLFDMQVINRVGWDNAVRPPDDNELGWKDTLRVSPLEDTIIALKPVAPVAPFGVPDSFRPYNPAASIGATMGFSNLDPLLGQPIVPPVTNQVVNFGWEYVWHCHILSHEEMDMMRPMSFEVTRSLPATPSLAATGLPGAPIDLTWTDGTPGDLSSTWGNPANEVGFRVERAEVSSAGVESTYSVVANVPANTTAWTDTTTFDGRAYRYIVYAHNAAGEVGSNYVTIAPPAFFLSYVITPVSFGPGAIAPAVPTAVPVNNDSPVFAITPNTGAHLTDVLVDGVSEGPITSRQFLNVTNDHTLWARFAVDTFTVTPTAGPGGSIAPPATQVVAYGADSTMFDITPNTGYHIADVVVDGTSIGPVTSHQFTNVTANHTIDVTFAIDTFTIVPSWSAAASGSISPATTQTVDYGANSSTFTITPAVGYSVGDVLVDGVSVGPVSAYKFTNVKANHTISATFAYKTMRRISGSDRYAVALAAARGVYPGWTGVTHAVIVGGTDNAQIDAVSAAGLAGSWDAPLLLVPGGSLRSDVRNAIAGMPAGLKVTIVGGTGSVSNTVFNAIKALPNVASVDRIGGSDRYVVSSNVARRMHTELGGAFPNTVLLANGDMASWMYDPLAASAVSAKRHFPVMLVRSTSVPVNVSSAMFDLGLTERWVVGNTTAVPDTVRSAAGVPVANRISGTNRFGTAAALATKAKTLGWLTNSKVGFAAVVPDAITGGAYMGKIDGALLYVNSTSVPAETSAYLTGAKAGITGGFVFGGTGSVSTSVSDQLLTLIR